MSSAIKELLTSKGFWVLNKEVVKKIGVESALILSVFSEADDMLADDEGWFYQTAPTIQELTGMTNHKQTKAIEKLIKLEILSQENRGLPCKRYFKINYEKVEKLVFKNFENCNLKNLKTGIQKISNNKEHNINNIDKEHINKKIDRYPKGIGENNHRVETQVTSNEVINQSLDTDKVKFRENLKKYMNMVSNVTNKTIMEISNVINPQSMKDYDLNLLIEEIENSDFLSGKLNKKPMITNFTRKTMIDRILIGEYRNKVEEKETKIIKIYENKEIENVSIEI